MFQHDRIRDAISEILEAIGENPSREGLADTPERVATMYAQAFSGILEDPSDVLGTGFAEEYSGPVVVRDVSFYSLCEHHLLPFFGKVHIGYIPNGWIVGASKLIRAFQVLTRRPQLQERLTKTTADVLVDGLDPMGVAVVVEAEHLCMTMRGIEKPGAKVVTSTVRGTFNNTDVSREELMALVRGN